MRFQLVLICWRWRLLIEVVLLLLREQVLRDDSHGRDGELRLTKVVGDGELQLECALALAGCDDA